MTDKTKIVLDENNKIDQLIMKILQNADKRQIEEIDSVLRIYTLTNGSSVNENLQSSLMAGLPTSYIPDEHINYLKLSNYVNLIKKMSSEYDLKTPSQTASISPQIIAEIKNLLKTFPLYDLTKPRVNNACTEKLDKIRDVLEIAKNNPYSIVLKGDLLKQECLDYIEGKNQQ